MKQRLEQLLEHTLVPLEDAKCLPFDMYNDEHIYEYEKQEIVHSDWVFACAEQQLPDAGDYLAFTLAGEPLVIIRGQDGQLRALSNVCRHRGTLINNEGIGKTKHFVCPYHAWTYNDEGKLLGVPHDKNKVVDITQHCLPQFSLETWQSLVFVNLNKNAQPLTQRFSGIERYLSLYKAERFQHFFPGATENWHCNWKIAMENAMESYHLFKVHKETLETITPTKLAFYLEGGTDWSLTAGKYQQNGGLVNWLLGEGEIIDQHYILISLPPSFVGILSKESFDWICVHPVDKHHCTVQSGGLSIKGKESESDKQFSDAFLAEDKAICERVQQGMQAKHTTGGKLIDLERIVVDFHHYLACKLLNRPSPERYTSQDNIFFKPES